MSISIPDRQLRPPDSTSDSPDPDALTSAIAQQRDVVFAFEFLVADARDTLARAGAELDLAVRQRDRAIWDLARLGEFSESEDAEER